MANPNEVLRIFSIDKKETRVKPEVYQRIPFFSKYMKNRTPAQETRPGSLNVHITSEILNEIIRLVELDVNTIEKLSNNRNKSSIRADLALLPEVFFFGIEKLTGLMADRIIEEMKNMSPHFIRRMTRTMYNLSANSEIIIKADDEAIAISCNCHSKFSVGLTTSHSLDDFPIAFQVPQASNPIYPSRSFFPKSEVAQALETCPYGQHGNNLIMHI